MSEYIKGRVYRVTAHADEVGYGVWNGSVFSGAYDSGENLYRRPRQCTSIVGPLPVLDLGHDGTAADHLLPNDLERAGFLGLARQIREQIPAKPRMDEPGWGEKVVARTKGNPERREFLHICDRGNFQWSIHEGRVFAWTELIDPAPIGGAA